VAQCQLDTWQNFNFLKKFKKINKKFKKSKNPEADT